MSKVFFDKYISVKKLEKYISLVATSLEEKEELWQLVDEILHHRILHCMLDELPKKHHKKFLLKLYDAPHDENILQFLQQKISKDIKSFIELEVESIEHEILKDLQKK